MHYVSMYACTYIHTHTHTYIHTYINIMYVCMYVCMYASCSIPKEYIIFNLYDHSSSEMASHDVDSDPELDGIIMDRYMMIINISYYHYIRSVSDDIIMAMLEQKLPTYVVNCFTATGFDDIESIREMDICSGKELSDLHINASQELLKEQFKHINGLQSTLFQLKRPLANTSDILQIIHVNGNHWAVVSTIGSTSVCYYDNGLSLK